MNHSSSDYLDAVMEAGLLPVESDELPNDLASLAKSSAEAYRENPRRSQSSIRTTPWSRYGHSPGQASS